MPTTKRLTRVLLHDKNTQKLELLVTPICQLGLKMRGTILEKAVEQASMEAQKMGIVKLRPFFYLADSYGTVEGTANIGLGFYDSKTLIQELNQEWRGWRHSEGDILLTIRHELGHAFCYSYKLYRNPEFRDTFHVRGNFFRTYPQGGHFRHNPWSRDFVNPCGDHYAQKHPDEDFAETFSVWLTPGSKWWQTYRHRPGALRKLEFVEEVVSRVGRRDPAIDNNESNLHGHVDGLKMNLADFLGAKPARYRKIASGFVDADLAQIFRKRPRVQDGRRFRREYLNAAEVLREQCRGLVNTVSDWARVEESAPLDFVDKCISRARALDLWVHVDERERALMTFAGYLSARCTDFARTGAFFQH